MDDLEPVQHLVRHVLRQDGHTVFVTADPFQAIAITNDEAIDLLISDVSMPSVDGPTLVAAIRAARPTLPVVNISAAEHPDGAPVLVKPFKPNGLLEAVVRVMRRDL